MTNYFIIPGYQDSGADHWQMWIETTQANFHRIQQRNYDNPYIEEWAEIIDKAIGGHINNLSGYGEWEQGMKVLAKLG